ncbi:MAG: hypothetical protein HQL26_06615 [Candidatus Omnitrophica bacterium]|nr:hypothetical protein [Candidatus Omnitrophota bacterium]
MNKNKLIIMGSVLLSATALWAGVAQVRAQEQTPQPPLKSHDAQAIMQRRMKRVTTEQREAAAARRSEQQNAATLSTTNDGPVETTTVSGAACGMGEGGKNE